MANPITPRGRRIVDPIEEARRQDQERRIREDNAYFERTGINRPPAVTYDPLVDNDIQDVANDGDSYEENPFNRNSSLGRYVEDSPTRIIDPDSRRNMASNRELGNILDSFNSSRRAPRNEREAYIQRENIKQDKEFKEKSEKIKNKFNNPISGLELD